MNRKKLFIIGVIVMLLPLLLSIAFYAKLPDPMATHFNFQGQPDGYSSKLMGAFGTPALMLLLYGVLFFMTQADPKRRNHGKVAVGMILLLFPIFMLFIHGLSLAYNLGYRVSMSTWIMGAVGVLFVLLGNYFPKIKRNYTVGIKTPWTLDDDEVWDKTHRLAGYLWMAGGSFFILLGILGRSTQLIYVFLGIVVVMSVLPAIYAYFLHRRKYPDR